MTDKKRRNRISMWFPVDADDIDRVYKFESPEIAGYWLMLCRIQWQNKGSALPNEDTKLARLL